MGRIFSLIFSLFGVFVTSAAGTWWFNTVAIGLFLRWVERYRVVRQGSLRACIGILLGIWAAFSVLTAILVFVVFIVLAVVSGVFAGFSEVREAIGAAHRRRFLFDPTPPITPNPAVQDVDVSVQNGPGRRIVILCDGPPTGRTITPTASLSRPTSGS